MFFEIIIAVFLGCVFGVITGLIPGLHINLVALILLSISPFLLGYTNVIAVASFIIAMSITHTFTDFIASTYLGAPNDDTALAVLPAHKLLLEGKGHEAIRLTLIGSLLCLIFTIIISPILILIVPIIFENVKDHVGWILLGILLMMIFREGSKSKKLWISVVVLLSGTLGVIALNMPNLKDPLLPMLSGLFGVSVLLLSLAQKTKIPEQNMGEEIIVNKKDTAKAIASGIFSGSLISIFPGLGPAQAAVLAGQIVRKINTHSYLILIGGINTVSMILSLITLFTIGKARNGSIIVVEKLLHNINPYVLILFFAVALIAGGIATFMAIYVSRAFSKVMSRINYSVINISIIVFITLMALYFSGWVGLIILAVGTAVGLIANLTNVSRSSSMACLIVPIILFSLL